MKYFIKKLTLLTILFLISKIGISGSLVLINNGVDKVFINNSDFFGKGSMGITLNKKDSIKLEYSTQYIIISVGFGNSTGNNHFILFENNKRYLLAKKDANIIVSEKGVESIFSAHSTLIANYFYDRFKSMQYDFEPISSKSLELVERHNFLQNQYIERKSYLDSISLEFNLNKKVIDNWNSLLYSIYVYNLYNYQTFQYLYKDKIFNFYIDSASVFLKKASENQFLENHIASIAYNVILISVNKKKISDINISDLKLTSNQNLNDYYLSYVLNSKINENKIIDSIEIEKYQIFCENKTYKKNIQEKIRMRTDFIVGVNPTNNLFLINNSQKIISIDSILKLSYNKIVYVDFWASWCPPCIKEIKGSKKTREKILHENFLYVYISMDESTNNYERVSKQLGLSIYPYSFLVKNPNHEFLTKELKVNSLPRYVIIKNGKVVNSFAPRPSEKDFLTILKKYK